MRVQKGTPANLWELLRAVPKMLTPRQGCVGSRKESPVEDMWARVSALGNLVFS